MERQDPEPTRAPPVDEVDATRARRVVTGTFVIAVAFAALLALIKGVRIIHVGTLWDDAYIFQRYAGNVLAEHRIAWNPGGAATYGTTTPAFLLVVVPILAACRNQPALSASLASAIPGVVFLAMLAWMLARHTGVAAAPRRVALAFVMLTLALSSTTDHFASGMDTTFGLAFATGYLVAAYRASGAPSRGRAVLLGVLGGLAYWVRPELLLYSALVPAALAALGEGPLVRRAGVVALGVTLLVLGAELLVAQLYFGSALPLPFYAKSTGLYGTHIAEVYRGVSTVEILAFLSGYWPLFTIVLLDAIVSRRARGEGRALERGVLAATLLLIAYHWFVVVPVMHYASRFYQPTVPALAWLTARALGRFHGLFAAPSRDGGHDEAGERAWRPALLGVVLAFLAYQAGGPLFVAGKDFFLAIHERRFTELDIWKHATTEGPRGYWYGLDRFMKLPDDLVIATTEVGMPGAMSPKKVIVDLAGLNDTEFGRKPFSADRLFARYRPDLIYMPHSVYDATDRALRAAPELAGYDVYSRAELATKDFGVAIRKDSKYYAAMLAIMGKHTPERKHLP